MNEPVLIGADRHCMFLQTVVVIPVMDLARTKFFWIFFWVSFAVIRKRGSVRAGHFYFFSTPFDIIMVGSNLTVLGTAAWSWLILIFGKKGPCIYPPFLFPSL